MTLLLAAGCRDVEPAVGTSRLAAYSCFVAPNLQYFGGPVVQNPKLRAVNWGSGVDPAVYATLGQFYAAILSSPYLDGLSEYDTIGRYGLVDGQPGSQQAIARGTFAGMTTITPAQCPGTAPCTISDAEIQAELAAQIAAGTLPAPTQGCDGKNDTIYMLAFAPSVSFDKQGSGVCLPGCTYHGTATHAGRAFPYVVVADATGAQCNGLCGGSSRPLDNLTAAASHGLLEAITNPNVGLADRFERPMAWTDAQCGEVASICERRQGTITIGAVTWTVQQQWSNAEGSCVVSRAALPPICTSPGAPEGCRSCGCADNLSGPPEPGQIGCTGGSWCDTNPNSATLGTCTTSDGGPLEDAGGGTGQEAGPVADGGTGGGGDGCGCDVGQLERTGGGLPLLLVLAGLRRRCRPASGAARPL